jgi:hypothetical protein
VLRVPVGKSVETVVVEKTVSFVGRTAFVPVDKLEPPKSIVTAENVAVVVAALLYISLISQRYPKGTLFASNAGKLMKDPIDPISVEEAFCSVIISGCGRL